MGYGNDQQPFVKVSHSGGLAEMGSVLKNVPNAVWWLIGVVFVSVVGAFTYLASIGADATEIRTFINTLANLGSLLLGGGGLAFGAAAAINSKKAADQTNGKRTDTVRQAIREEMGKEGDNDGRPAL